MAESKIVPITSVSCDDRLRAFIPPFPPVATPKASLTAQRVSNLSRSMYLDTETDKWSTLRRIRVKICCVSTVVVTKPCAKFHPPNSWHFRVIVHICKWVDRHLVDVFRSNFDRNL
ncbi:hypothetical protein AVEN_76464-1 [Araneus ventricosus]|uniref:Uncharacterized protein n=1 Tax=Araneus ventricosus TaxID=182803 RepID=A0A4Y2CEP6_ARAVE|nr:hypothetical protein AVEN_76464-1 [Araneus ventricosus]